MNKFLTIYIRSNLHVSLAAVAMVIYTYVSNDVAIDWNYASFIFSSTLSLYALHGIYDNKKQNHIVSRQSNTKSFKSLFIIVALIGIIFSGYQYLRFDLGVQIALILPILISSLYVLPLLKGKKLRDFPMVKIFFIAISWSLLCSFIPLLYIDIILPSKILGTIITALYVFAITIPFDIRDFEIDKRLDTITLPIKYGILPSIKTAHISLIAAMLIVLFHIKSCDFDIISAVSILISIALAFPLISRTRPGSPDYYVSGIIEGLLILPLIMYYLLDFIF